MSSKELDRFQAESEVSWLAAFKYPFALNISLSMDFDFTQIYMLTSSLFVNNNVLKSTCNWNSPVISWLLTKKNRDLESTVDPIGCVPDTRYL